MRAVYQIQCKQCENVYIGETGTKFRTRLNEHMIYTCINQKSNYTQAGSKTSQTEVNTSAITDHLVQNYHLINREGVSMEIRE